MIVADASVEVSGNTSTFGATVKRSILRQLAGFKPTVTVNADIDPAKAAIDRLKADLTEMSRGATTITVRVNQPSAASLARLERLAAAVRDLRSVDANLRIKLSQPSAASVARLGALRDAVANLDRVNDINLRVDLNGVNATLLGRLAGLGVVLDALDGRSIDITINVHGELEALAGLRELSRATNGNSNGGRGGIGGLVGAADSAGAAFGRLIGGSLRVLRPLAFAAAGGFAVLAGKAALGGVVQTALLAYQALQPLVGFIAAAPAALLTGGIAMGVLAVGTSGFAKALKDMSDPKKFAKDIAKLAPAARDSAIAVQGLTRQFRDTTNAIQQSLFQGLAGQIKALGPLLQGLTPNLVGVAGGFNLIAQKFAGVLTAPATLATLKAAADTTSGALGSLAAAVQPLLTGLLDVGRHGLPFIQTLSDKLRDAAINAGAFLSAFASSGGVESALSRAGTAAHNLFVGLDDIGIIIHNVFSAANAAGVSAFGGVFGGILKDLAVFTSSSSGFGALTAFFQNAAAASDALLPVVGGLVQVFSALTVPLSNIAVALAPALARFLNGLAPAISTLGPVFTALGASLGLVVDALTPFLPLIADAVQIVGVQLAAAFIALIPTVGPIATAFADLLTQLAPLLPVLATALVPVIIAFTSALTAAAPGLVTLVNGLGPLLPLVVGLVAAFAVLPVGAIVSGLGSIVGAFSSLAGAITGVSAGEGALAGIAGALGLSAGPLTAVAAALAAVAGVVGFLIVKFEPLRAAIGAFASAFSSVLIPAVKIAIAVFQKEVQPVLTAFGALVNRYRPELIEFGRAFGKITSAVAGLAAILIAAGLGKIFANIALFVGIVIVAIVLLVKAVNGVISAFKAVIGAGEAVIGFFTNLGENVAKLGPIMAALPGVIGKALKDVSLAVAGAFADAAGAAVSGAAQIGQSVLDGLGKIPGLALQALKDLPFAIGFVIGAALGLLFLAFVKLPIQLVNLIVTSWGPPILAAISGAFSAVVSFFTNLPGQLLAGLQALPGLLSSAGSTAMSALTAAVSAGASATLNFFVNLPGQIWTAMLALGGLLLSVGSAALSALLSAVTAGALAVVGFFAGLPGRIISAVSGVASSLAGAAAGWFGGVVVSASRGFGDVLDYFGRIPGALTNALGDLFSIFEKLGEQVMNGLVSGIKKLASLPIDAVKSVGSGIASGFKSVVHIGSPSRLFADYGGFLMKGLQIGITKHMQLPVGAITTAARAVSTAGAAGLDMSLTGNSGPKTPAITQTTTQSAQKIVNNNVTIPGPVSRDLDERDVTNALLILNAVVPSS